MKTDKLFLCALLSLCGPGLHAQNYRWANTFGGSGADRANATAFDAAGNVYVTGTFSGTVDFDPGAATANLTAAGSTDAFIVKYSSAGAYLWSRRIGGAGGDNAGLAVAVDASGNVFAGGSFSGTADLDPGAGTVSRTSLGFTDGFVVKLDNNGNYLTSHTLGGPFSDQVSHISLDAAGNVYLSGLFSGIADFDPGSAAAVLDAADGILFMAKYSNSMGYAWARNTAATSGSFSVNAMSLDARGNIYLCGSFTGAPDFAPGAATATMAAIGYQDIYLAKYDPAGNHLWSSHMGCPSNVNTPRGLAVDPSGNVSITGNYYFTVDFDPGPGVANLTATGLCNIFVAQYDSLGKYKWAKGLSGSLNSSVNQGTTLCTDADGNLYVGGYFGQSIRLDPVNTSATLTARMVDIFIAKYDHAGAYIWSRSFPAAHGVLLGTGNVDAHLALDASGNMYISGSFVDTTDFGMGASGASRTSAGNYDAYVSKYGVSGTGIARTVLSDPSFAVYPNPADDRVTLSYELDALTPVSVSVTDMQGRLVAAPFRATQGGGRHSYILRPADHGLAAGAYFITLRAGDESVTRRLVLNK